MPICPYPGMRPIRKVAPDMMRMDQDSAHRRPYRSPQLPQKSAPIGRRMKDSAKTAKVSNSAAVSSPSGKKTIAMTVAK